MISSLSNLEQANNSLSFEIASQLYSSDGDFPINFEIAWQWLGYTRKDSAKKKLVKNFIEGEDYTLRQVAESAPSGGLTHWDDIWLSVNCLKEMGMLAGTNKGKEVRNYFLQCEAIAKQSAASVPELLQRIQQTEDAIALLQSQVQNLLPPSADFIPPGWDADVWEKLPPQDKRHFRYLFRRRRFRPSNQGNDNVLALPPITPERIRQKQLLETEQLIGEMLPEEKERLEAVKEQALKQLWAEGGQENE
ncbi:hypothetical protein [Dendronalium sp. ChiSLP03b]|uniref:hypothetical protein n=1 Tax=Dendronalium sp. ChiSLP03b TaxID=3075381 RepID=UPI00391BB578